MRKTLNKRIAIYGSSVNPPTRAHREILRTFSEMTKGENKVFDEIWMFPVYRHQYDYKIKQLKSVTFEERILMCKLAFDASDRTAEEMMQEIEEKRFIPALFENVHVLPIEEEVFQFVKDHRPGIETVGTSDTLKYLETQEKYKMNEYHWIMGQDNFEDMCEGKWAGINELMFRLTSVQIILRPVHGAKPDEKISMESSRIGLEKRVANLVPKDVEENEQEKILTSFRNKINVVDLNKPELRNVSSSAMKRAKSKEELLIHVPETIASYIELKQLYFTKDWFANK